MFYLSLTFVIALLAVYLRKWYASTKSRKSPYHPGPKPLPLIGNALDIPKVSPWLTYANWRQQYGDIIHLSALGKHIIVLNSLAAATDLLDKRSSNYSDRPDIPMANMTGWTAINIGLIHYGDLWRKHRRLFHQKFRHGMVSDLQPLQTHKIHTLLRNLLDSPEDFKLHLRNFPASVIMSATYGYEILPKNDPIVTLVDETSAMITETIFLGSQLVNVLPALQRIPEWMPGAGFKRIANLCRSKLSQMMDTPFQAVKDQMAKGEAPVSWTSELLEHHAQTKGDEEGENLIKGVAATAFAVAADTSASSLTSFVLAMLLYPETMIKAQMEIDSLLQSREKKLTRLPTYEDRDLLPYTTALCHEILRWSPAVPLGVPHASLEDDFYDGYLIPAGTMVLSNIWAMSRDERIYPNPHRFDPDRFLSTDKTQAVLDPLPTFGFGRRICVGRFLAEETLWIGVTTLLTCFNITKAKDNLGNEIFVSGEYDDKLISHPLPFKCSITPRSEETVKLIRSLS